MKDKINSYLASKGFDFDETLIEEYVNFCYDNQYDGKEYSEKHHILLRKHFPEFIEATWNIVRLKYRDHIKAHELLAEAMPSDKKANYAYFFMKAKNGELDSELREKNAERFRGEANPAKRSDIRKKISDAKSGKPREDMIGTRYFGASEETISNIRKRASEVHTGTVPVRLPDGTVIKIKTDDPRYISGELKCIIGAKKGDRGPTSDPEVKARFKETIEKRRQKFALMTGEEIAAYCYEMKAIGKAVFKNGRLTGNYTRLFGYANLDAKDFIKDDRQGSTTIESPTSNLVEDWSQ